MTFFAKGRMKKICKSLLALVLMIILSLGVFVGCGADKTNAGDNPSRASIETAESENQTNIDESGEFTSKEDVALYVHIYGHLPSNYITKREAQSLGWKDKGTLDQVAPGKSIGGDRFGNYEQQLPTVQGRTYYECDIDYVSGNRNAKRIIYSDDGEIYYTEDHYQSFEHLYGDDK